MVQYRPIVIAKRGELTAMNALPVTAWAGLKPVLQVPPREWDHEVGAYKKSPEAHLLDLPKKFATATKSHPAFIDVSLLDNTSPVFGGRHPLAWIVDEAATHGLALTPFVQLTSTADTIAAAADVHARTGSGVGVRLPSSEWVSINARPLPALLTACGVAPSEVDLFVDVAREFSLVVQRAVLTELSTQDGSYSFRSRSLGGAGFPDTAGLTKGLSEFSRDEWKLFREVYRGRLAAGTETPDFFDNVVNNPDAEVGLVNPKFLMISALFRYTTDEEWLVVKGGLYKGPAGKSLGSAAMMTPLTLLRAHPKFSILVRTKTDEWIEEVLAGTKNPGSPEVWRRWATQRHLTIVVRQLASPI